MLTFAPPLESSVQRGAQKTIVNIGPWLPSWIFCLILQVAMLLVGLNTKFSSVSYHSFFSSTTFTLFIQSLSFITLYHATYVLLVKRPKFPIRHFWHSGKNMLANPAQFIIPAMNYICLIIVTFSFDKLKSMISIIHPFSWDATFYKLDRALHFGIDPWQITHSVLSSDTASWMINFFYNLWFFILFVFIFGCILGKQRPSLRAQFLLTMTLSWVLIGFVAATIFSSAGPCYYAHVVRSGANPYAELLQNLHAIHARLLAQHFPFGLPAIATQDLLWRDFITGGALLGGGISAFPSMHMAMATAMALLASRLDKRLGGAMWLFAVIIQIGTVHLGWHYAVDGYASCLITLLIWSASGWLVRKSDAWYLARHRDQLHLHARL
jgi:hypothetical protein